MVGSRSPQPIAARRRPDGWRRFRGRRFCDPCWAASLKRESDGGDRYPRGVDSPSGDGTETCPTEVGRFNRWRFSQVRLRRPSTCSQVDISFAALSHCDSTGLPAASTTISLSSPPHDTWYSRRSSQTWVRGSRCASQRLQTITLGRLNCLVIISPLH